MSSRMSIALTVLCVVVQIGFAGDCPLAHTHIGINPTWRPDWSDPENASLATDPDPTDDNKLCFFSLPPAHTVAPTPGWPDWKQANGDPFLQLVPVLEGGSPIMKGDGSGKQLWTCQFMYSQSGGYGDPTGVQHLDGWHSADDGEWILAGGDQSTPPVWDIYIKREGTSVASDDFFMLLPNDTPVLTADGQTYQLGKEWLPEEDAWGIHEHMTFNFWLTPDTGRQVTATFSAFDMGGIYTPSDDFEFAFVTVPEPASMVLLGLGALPLLRRGKNKCKAQI